MFCLLFCFYTCFNFDYNIVRHINSKGLVCSSLLYCLTATLVCHLTLEIIAFFVDALFMCLLDLPLIVNSFQFSTFVPHIFVFD